MKLLAAIDRGNPSGKRDYAIVLLVARLGIRIGDVNNLKFENIDWRKNNISFVQNKTGNRVTLPLLKDVGWAIIDYVKNGRPKMDSPYLFLTHIPPFKNYAGENHLYATIQKYLSLTDIQDQPRKKRGMHSLRHTLAIAYRKTGSPIIPFLPPLAMQARIPQLYMSRLILSFCVNVPLIQRRWDCERNF